MSISILETINNEIKTAMRSKDSFRLNTLKYIKALLQNNAIDKTASELDVVMGHHKKMVKSLDMFSGDSLESLKNEISIIEEFLPKTMSIEEINSIIERHKHLGNFGLVMKAVKEEMSGPFDGKLVSNLIKSKLS